jgi:hypothetical protein
MAGTIITGATAYAVDCAGVMCNGFETWHTYTKIDFIRSLRKEGWRMRSGLWVCSKCLELYEGKQKEQSDE